MNFGSIQLFMNPYSLAALDYSPQNALLRLLSLPRGYELYEGLYHVFEHG
jgi:hypothetical protein